MKDVGVIVGRFQVDSLHQGHIDLIQKVLNNHSKVIIFLGLSPCKCTVRNPLDFEARKQMILSKFPNIIVLYILDQYSDIGWSDNLDSQVQNIIGPNQSVMLYGSRDSFIKYYSGRFDCTELEQTVFISGTDIRKKIANTVSGTAEFRKGVIWTVNNQYPSCYPTVDAAILKESRGETSILLGKRTKEPLYRFIGGFVQPGETFEDAVIREVEEETGLTFINPPRYLKSFVIDDWRYRSEVDKITSSLFVFEYSGGIPTPADDINELRIFPLNRNILSSIVDEHKNMMKFLLDSKQL